MIDEAALACCACCSIKWYVHEQDGLCFGEWRCDNCNRPFVPREHGAREREQLRGELEREQRDRRNLRVELEIANEAAAKERSRVDEAWRQLAAAVAARDQARKDFEGLREQIALAQRERDEARARAELNIEAYQKLAVEKHELAAALTSQQQATDEALRRAEEARRG